MIRQDYLSDVGNSNDRIIMSSLNIVKIYFVLAFIFEVVISVTLKKGSITLNLEPTSNGIKLEAYKDNVIKLRGTLGVNNDFSTYDCIGKPLCKLQDRKLEITPIQDGYQVRWSTSNKTSVFQDCFDLEDDVQWYGGPERKKQSWPIQKLKISGDQAYVLRQLDNFAVAERYWLNSKGAYIYVGSKVPLFVDQNEQHVNKVCFIAKIDGPYILRERNFLDYSIILKDDPKQAHLHAVNLYLGKPTGYPDVKMIAEPIWTTWAKYKTKIDDKTVIEFAQDIRNNGYQKGQIEIDDEWEVCYGAQEFASSNFPEIGNTVTELKNLDFRVTIWIHPFVNSDCQNNSNIGIEKGYFVKSTNGSTNGSWWNGLDAHQIDFTNPKASEWWTDRLKKLQSFPGIDSFKFDAGETDYAPQPAYYPHVDDIEDVPNILSEKYVRTCAGFGPLVEVRSGSRTQDLPIFVRMIDKDSNWGDNNGLYTLITTLFQMNLNGYTLVLPDMIGGNGYNNTQPSSELLVRWAQANTFMPAMQFSYLPWEVNSDKYNVSEIVLSFVELHGKYSDIIVRAMQQSIETGTPVNPPIWWIAPTDSKALSCDDEFLLGEFILIAPVMVEGATSRNIYLPKGNWIDGNNGSIYQGPIEFDYPANISTLPYFILNNSFTKFIKNKF